MLKFRLELRVAPPPREPIYSHSDPKASPPDPASSTADSGPRQTRNTRPTQHAMSMILPLVSHPLFAHQQHEKETTHLAILHLKHTLLLPAERVLVSDIHRSDVADVRTWRAEETRGRPGGFGALGGVEDDEGHGGDGWEEEGLYAWDGGGERRVGVGPVEAIPGGHCGCDGM